LGTGNIGAHVKNKNSPVAKNKALRDKIKMAGQNKKFPHGNKKKKSEGASSKR
jgi:hypothetical protein